MKDLELNLGVAHHPSDRSSLKAETKFRVPIGIAITVLLILLFFSVNQNKSSEKKED